MSLNFDWTLAAAEAGPESAQYGPAALDPLSVLLFVCIKYCLCIHFSKPSIFYLKRLENHRDPQSLVLLLACPPLQIIGGCCPEIVKNSSERRLTLKDMLGHGRIGQSGGCQHQYKGFVVCLMTRDGTGVAGPGGVSKVGGGGGSGCKTRRVSAPRSARCRGPSLSPVTTLITRPRPISALPGC